MNQHELQLAEATSKARHWRIEWEKHHATIAGLDAENKRLRKAIGMLSEPTCYSLHHKKAHLHESYEDCPAQAAYEELIK